MVEIQVICYQTNIFGNNWQISLQQLTNIFATIDKYLGQILTKTFVLVLRPNSIQIDIFGNKWQIYLQQLTNIFDSNWQIYLFWLRSKLFVIKQISSSTIVVLWYGTKMFVRQIFADIGEKVQNTNIIFYKGLVNWLQRTNSSWYSTSPCTVACCGKILGAVRRVGGHLWK